MSLAIQDLARRIARSAPPPLTVGKGRACWTQESKGLINFVFQKSFPKSFSKILTFCLLNPSLDLSPATALSAGPPQKSYILIFLDTFSDLFFALIFGCVLGGKSHQNRAPNPSKISLFTYFFVDEFRSRIFEGPKGENECFA